MTIIWFSIILIYFGITLHMSSLGGNVYINTVRVELHLYRSTCPFRRKIKSLALIEKIFFVNQIIAGSVEAFSIAFSVFVVLKLGLRVNLFIYLVIAGLACGLINFAREDNLWLTISLAMIGELFSENYRENLMSFTRISQDNGWRVQRYHPNIHSRTISR